MIKGVLFVFFTMLVLLSTFSLTGCGTTGATSVQEIQAEKAEIDKSMDLAAYMAKREDEHPGCGEKKEGQVLNQDYDLDTWLDRTTVNGLKTGIFRSGNKRGDCLQEEEK